MISAINEGAVRVATKVDPSTAIHERAVHQEKAEAVAEARPVEASMSGDKAQSEEMRDDGSTGKFLVDDKRVVFEKYDRNGNVILRIPPSQKPVDEIV